MQSMKSLAFSYIDQLSEDKLASAVDYIKYLCESSGKAGNAAYLAKLDAAIEDAREHGVYEYLGKNEHGEAIFSETPQEAAI